MSNTTKTITNEAELEAALNWLNENKEEMPEVSGAIVSYWTQSPSRFLIIGTSVRENLAGQGIKTPVNLDAEELSDSFFEFAGWNRLNGLKGFYWNGSEKLVYLGEVEKGNAREELLKWWANQNAARA